MAWVYNATKSGRSLLNTLNKGIFSSGLRVHARLKSVALPLTPLRLVPRRQTSQLIQSLKPAEPAQERNKYQNFLSDLDPVWKISPHSKRNVVIYQEIVCAWTEKQFSVYIRDLNKELDNLKEDLKKEDRDEMSSQVVLNLNKFNIRAKLISKASVKNLENQLSHYINYLVSEWDQFLKGTNSEEQQYMCHQLYTTNEEIQKIFNSKVQKSLKDMQLRLKLFLSDEGDIQEKKLYAELEEAFKQLQLDLEIDCKALKTQLQYIYQLFYKDKTELNDFVYVSTVLKDLQQRLESIVKNLNNHEREDRSKKTLELPNTGEHRNGDNADDVKQRFEKMKQSLFAFKQQLNIKKFNANKKAEYNKLPVDLK